MNKFFRVMTLCSLSSLSGILSYLPALADGASENPMKFDSIFGHAEPTINHPPPHDRSLPHISTVCGGQYRTMSEDYRDLIDSNFDPSSLSKNKRVTVTVKVSIAPNGSPVCKSGQVSASDRFYCEQAIWEAAPFKFQKQYFGEVAFTAEARTGTAFVEKYFSEHPKLRGKVVIIHTIPRHSKTLSQIENDGRLAAIPISQLSSPALSRWRNEWLAFLSSKSDPTIAELTKQAGKMQAKYHSLFL